MNLNGRPRKDQFQATCDDRSQFVNRDRGFKRSSVVLEASGESTYQGVRTKWKSNVGGHVDGFINKFNSSSKLTKKENRARSALIVKMRYSFYM